MVKNLPAMQKNEAQSPKYSLFTWNLYVTRCPIFIQQRQFTSSESPKLLVAQLVNNPPAMQETWVWSLGWEGPLEKGKDTHSSTLAWRIPWTVQSMGCKESDTTMGLSLLLLPKEEDIIDLSLLPIDFMYKTWKNYFFYYVHLIRSNMA